MSAPDAQPPAVPELWWSPSWGVLTKAVTGSGTPFYHHHRAGEALFDPPADAVRLTADEMAAGILDANERMGEALVAIGMALGMPAPRTGATWGAPEILARIGGSAALAGTTTPTGPSEDVIEKLAGAIYACDADPPLNARTVPERWAVYQAQARNIVWPAVAALLASTPTTEDPS